MSMVSEDEVRRMYIDDGMSSGVIAEKIGISKSAVLAILRRYSIPIRSNSESQLIGKIKPGKEELEQMYIDSQMSTCEIAKEIGVEHGTVYRWLRKYGILIRDLSESQLIKTKNPGKEELERMYIDSQMSTYEIAKEIGVSYFAIHNWLREYGISIRSQSELVGILSHNWQGGISFIPYCHKFNNKFKEAIRERDDYTCQLCGAEQNGRRLSVHHIHYDKENCYPDCVALCHSCNSAVNGNRDYYESLFEEQLRQRGLLNWSMSEIEI